MPKASLSGVERVQDLPGESGVRGGYELLAWCHGFGDVGEGIEAVVEGERVAVEGQGGAASGVQDVVARGEVPDGEAFGEFDGGIGEASGDMAEADRAEVDADAAAK